MLGSYENVLNWCSSFCNSKGCKYLHMISEILFQIFINTFCMLKFLPFMRNCLPLLENSGVSTVMMNLLKGTCPISLVWDQ